MDNEYPHELIQNSCHYMSIIIHVYTNKSYVELYVRQQLESSVNKNVWRVQRNNLYTC